jgi:aspartate ammonia-lyase
VIGYEAASRVAKEALGRGRPVREIVLEWGLLATEELDRLLAPEAMTRPRALAPAVATGASDSDRDRVSGRGQ